MMMSLERQVRFTRVVFLVAVMVCLAAAPRAQDNPYRVVEGWPQLPQSVKLGGVISVPWATGWQAPDCESPGPGISGLIRASDLR